MPLIAGVTAEAVDIALRRPFATAQDRLARQGTRGVRVSVHIDDGTVAVGDAMPVSYVTGETPDTVLAAVAEAAPALIEADTRRLRPTLGRLMEALPHAPTARAGLEMAIYDAWSQATGVSLWELAGGAIRSVSTDITLSISPDALDHAREAAHSGFRHFKMKVGGPDPEADLERVVAVHRSVPGAKIRLDANQGFHVAEALDFIARVVAAGVHLELVEQPVPKDDLAGLDDVAAASQVPVFADEAVKSPADAIRVLRETRAHGINLKLMKAGIAGAMDIVAITRAAGRRLMIGCMLETRRGIGAAVAIACGTGAFDFVDLDSHLLLDEPGENPFFAEEGPVLSVLVPAGR